LVPLPSRLGTLSSITHSFPWLSSPRGYVTYVVLPRSPLSPLRVLARLACLIHAANVHSEPGSNPFDIVFTQQPTYRVFPRSSSATEYEHVWVCLPTHAKDNPQQLKSPCGNPCHYESPSLPKLTFQNSHVRRATASIQQSCFSEPSNQIVKERRLAT
jgi:hypothetical protein